MNRTVYLALMFACIGAVPSALGQTAPTHRPGDLDFKLRLPLEFKGRTVSGTLRQSEIAGLLDLPVRNGDTDPAHKYGVEMTTPNKGLVQVYTCREWLRARKLGEYSATTYDMAMEASLIQTCGLLYELQSAKPPVKSFVSNPRVTISEVDLLPAEMLASMPEGDRDDLRGKTIAQVVASKDVQKSSAEELDLSYGGFQQWFSEAGRADFNGDGIEDIFVFTGGRAEGGTMGYSDYLVLTRTQPSGPLRIIEPKSDPLKTEREAVQ